SSDVCSSDLHDVDLMVYTQAYENSATLYIREPDELPSDFEIAKGCFATKAKLLDQWEDKIRQEFGQELYIVRADDCFLELLHPNVNKGTGLKELTEKLRSEEHTSELQSRFDIVCRLLLEKKKAPK